MRIKECWLTRYGPLAELGRILFSDFTLIFGENESGKTLLVDAFIKMLFKRKSEIATFTGVERVNESPEGYLILEVKGEELKLPEAGDIASITGISAEDCRSVFIVRNSDLKVPDERAFYTSVTDRLTGIHSVAIERIRKKLQEAGKLTNPTSDAQLSDREDFGKVKTAFKQAQNLLYQIKELNQQAQEEGFGDLERRALSYEQQIQEVDFHLEQMELANKREIYENAQGALAELRDALDTLNALENFDDEGMDSWRESHREIERFNGEIQDLDSSAKEVRKQLVEIRDTHKKAQAEYLRDQERKRAVDELQTDINVHKRRHEQVVTQTRVASAVGRTALVSATILLASVISLILSDIHLLQFITIGSGLALILLSAWWLYTSWLRASLSGELERLRLDAAKCGILGDDVEHLLSSLEEFIYQFDEERQEVERLNQQVETNENELKKTTNQIQANCGEVEKHQGVIRKISEVSGVSDLESYAAEVHRKANTWRDRDVQVARLKEILGLEKLPKGETIEVWEEKAQEFADFADKAIGVTFEREEFETIRTNRQELGKKSTDIHEQLSDFRRELNLISVEANSLLSSREVLPCDTLVDLFGITHKVEAFIDQIEQRKDLAIGTISLFERIAEREAEKVGELFGVESPVSKYLNVITGGVYEEVDFDRSSNQLRVRKSDGKTLFAYQLSGGTYDQMYLAVRLALAERLLQGEQGFLILDDPFLTSDTRRLRKQIDILHEFVKSGWQILYFSVKDEVRDQLAEDIRKKKVAIHELISIHRGGVV